MKLPRPIVSAAVAEEWIAFCNIVSGIWVGIVFATVEKGIAHVDTVAKWMEMGCLDGWLETCPNLDAMQNPIRGQLFVRHSY